MYVCFRFYLLISVLGATLDAILPCRAGGGTDAIAATLRGAATSDVCVAPVVRYSCFVLLPTL